jgi:hypothetical protein
MKGIERVVLVVAAFLVVVGLTLSPPAAAQQKQPNILVIWGDDIGYDNISAYNHGIMGYRTPNTDRLAKEGGIAPRSDKLTDGLQSVEAAGITPAASPWQQLMRSHCSSARLTTW